MEEEIEQNLLKRIRYLTQGLLISGSLNIALLATLVSLAFLRRNDSSSPLSAPRRISVSVSKANHDILNSYFTMAYGQLLEELRDTELLEDGYRRRDLALAYLAAFHFFDVEKALPGVSIQKRQMTFYHKEGGERLDLCVFPGLNDDHYQALLYFAHIENWPFTTEGLFYELTRRKEEAPSSLIETFYMTEEFHRMYNFLTHTGVSLSRGELTSVLLDGTFEDFHEFSQKFRENTTCNGEAGREFLLYYLRLKSKVAADLLIKLDVEYVLRKLTDTDITTLIDSLSEQASLEPFLKELIYSVRSDLVRQKAGIKLYAIAGEDPPFPYNHSETLKRFVPAIKKTQVQLQDPLLLYQENNSIPAQTKQRTHKVQDGETLWKISRKYKVDLDLLVKMNHLKSEHVLPVGKELVIP